MTDLSWTHILILMAVALIVVGPKDLPKITRTLGRWVGHVRHLAEEFRRNFDDMAREAELDELRAQVEKLKSERPLADVEAQMKRIFERKPLDAPSPAPGGHIEAPNEPDEKR